MKRIVILIALVILNWCYSVHSQVSESWIDLYNYEESNYDEPTDMVVDAAGNIYITGWTTSNLHDFITIKYNSSGELQWSQLFNGPLMGSSKPSGITLDNSGNVYVVGYTMNNWSDIAIIKYSPDGDELWVSYYDNTSTDGGYDIEVGENGMIYAVGYSNANMITLQYNQEGELQWANTFNGTENATDIGHALVLDTASNVYITGFSKNTGTSRDITTIKYNAEGVQQWVSIYDGPGHYSDEGYEIALDEMNNVYVLGYINDEFGHIQFATIKYNTDGEEQWVNWYFDSETLNGVPSGLAVYDSENIYATGSGVQGVPTIKLDASGDTVWTRKYSIGYVDQKGTDITTDDEGNIYVIGWVREEAGGWLRDYGTFKYNPDGDLLWDIRYQGLGEERDDPVRVCIDSENNVIVTGITNAGGTSYDFGTIKYLQTGTSNNEEFLGYSFPGDELRIFPNPARDKFKVQSLKFKVGESILEIYDLNGKKLLEKHIPAGSENTEINASSLESGLYICRLIDDERIVTQKLIIQK